MSVESKRTNGMRLPALLLCGAALAARRLRREARRARALGLEERRADAGLLPERGPRGHLRRPGRRRLQGGRPRRADPPTPGPGGADQAGRGGACGPGDLVRAGGAPGARPGPERGERGGARPEAAHLDHLAPQGEDPRARGPEGQDHRHGRDRLPGGVPQDDPGGRRRRPRHGQGPQRRLRLQPRAAHREDRRRAGRVLELRGRGPEAARQAPAHHPHRGRRRAGLQRAGAGGERDRRWSATATRSAPSSARSHAARASCGATRTGRSRVC